VGLVTLSQAESAGKVAGEKCFLLDGGKESLVNGLLVCCAAAGWLLLLLKLSVLAYFSRNQRIPYLWLLALLEKCLLASLLVTLLAGKVLV